MRTRLANADTRLGFRHLCASLLAVLTLAVLAVCPAAIAHAEPEPPATPTPSTAIGYGRGLTATVPLELSPTPTRRPARAPLGSLAALWALLPPVPTAVPQPSAFFVPRLITATLAVEDMAGARLQGRVLDWRGNGMASVVVRATTESGERSALTQPDGSYAIDGLPAGRYAVAVAGYEGLPAVPLPIDGQSIFIVEFVEAARPGLPGVTPTATVAQTPTAGPPLPTASPTASRPAVAAAPTASAARSTPTAKAEGGLLSSDDLDYVAHTVVTPFLLGAAGSYLLFLLGLFGARLRR